jgi:hypothetical protein
MRRARWTSYRWTAPAIHTDDFPLGDAVHFNTDAYREIGRRFAAAYLSLTGDAACRL